MMTNTTRRAVMAGLAAAPVAGLPAIASGAAGDDATLLELGRQLEAAMAHLNFAYSLIPDFDDDVAVAAERFAHEAHTRTGEIVDAIIETKATTLDGLNVKARALSWCHGGEFEGIAESTGNIWFDKEGKIVRETPTTDRLVVDSILFDLIALAAIQREPQS